MSLNILNKTLFLSIFLSIFILFVILVSNPFVSTSSQDEQVHTQSAIFNKKPRHSISEFSELTNEQDITVVKTERLSLVSKSDEKTEDYDNHFFEEKSRLIQSDNFGNHFVRASESQATIQRYLVSDWPIYYPSPQEKQEGNVLGCMSLNYYVSLDANVSLVVEEKSQFRMYHFVCEYDYALQTYQLRSLKIPPAALMDSIQSVVDNIQFASQ